MPPLRHAGNEPNGVAPHAAWGVASPEAEPVKESGLPALVEGPAIRIAAAGHFISDLRGKLVAGLTAVFLLGMLAVFRQWRRPRLTEQDIILLTDFTNTTGETVFDETLKRAVAIDLEQSPHLNVYPPQKVRQALKLMGKPSDGPVTPELGRADLPTHRRQGVRDGLNSETRQPLACLKHSNARNI